MLCTLGLGLALALGGCDPDADSGDDRSAQISIEIDISENMARFSFDGAPVFDDGMPAYGNEFVTQGYIYPAGFLDENPGTFPDGSPARPEEVLGEWTCRGVFVGDGVRTTSGPMVITTQLVELYDEPGWAPGKSGTGDMLVTEGYELAEVGASVNRPVTGGSGSYAGTSGQAAQVFLGFNDSVGVNLRQHIELRSIEEG